MEETRIDSGALFQPIVAEASDDDSSCGALMIDEPLLDEEPTKEDSSSVNISSNNNSLTSTPTQFSSDAVINGDEPPVMFHDPNLPEGWSRSVRQRTMGASAGKYDVYIFSPDKKKIRSKTDLTVYLNRNNITDLDPDQFDFTVRGKGNTPIKPSKSNKSRPRSRPTTKSPLAATKPKPADIKPKPADKPTPAASLTNGGPKNQSAPKAASSGSSMIVKFNFPVARLRRPAASSKNRIKKPKISTESNSATSDDESLAPPALDTPQEALTPLSEMEKEEEPSDEPNQEPSDDPIEGPLDNLIEEPLDEPILI